MTKLFNVFSNLYTEGVYTPNIKNGDYVDVLFPDEKGTVENEDHVPAFNAVQAIQFAANVTNYTGYVRVEKGTDLKGHVLWTELGFQNGKPSSYVTNSSSVCYAELEFEKQALQKTSQPLKPHLGFQIRTRNLKIQIRILI